LDDLASCSEQFIEECVDNDFVPPHPGDVARKNLYNSLRKKSKNVKDEKNLAFVEETKEEIIEETKPEVEATPEIAEETPEKVEEVEEPKERKKRHKHRKAEE